MKLSRSSNFAEKKIDEVLGDLRILLLESDVNLIVVRQLLQDVRKKIGEIETATSQSVYLAIKDSIYDLIGGKTHIPLRLTPGRVPPEVVMLTGVYGAGKTSSCGKLAYWLKNEMKGRVALVSTDTIRPAAQEQLKQLALQVGCKYLPCPNPNDPIESARELKKQLATMPIDFVVWDTAGRNVLDAELLSELKAIHEIAEPVDTLLTLDALTGQSALSVAQNMTQTVKLTGLLMTKMDSDTKGGAALSALAATGVPISFLASGEKITDIELMIPERLVGRLLGEGDLKSLKEKLNKLPDKDKMEKLAKKTLKGQGLSLTDLKQQMLQVKKMGGIAGVASSLPGMGAIPKGQFDEDMITKTVAVIDSMTPEERLKPQMVNSSRKKRIYKGSGTKSVDVSKTLNQHKRMNQALKKMKKMGGIEQFAQMMQQK